jgi:hypothetical protein
MTVTISNAMNMKHYGKADSFAWYIRKLKNFASSLKR